MTIAWISEKTGKLGFHFLLPHVGLGCQRVGERRRRSRQSQICRRRNRVVRRGVQVTFCFALEEAVECIKVPGMSVALSALPRKFDMAFTGLSERIDFLLGRGFRIKGLVQII